VGALRCTGTCIPADRTECFDFALLLAAAREEARVTVVDVVRGCSARA
jgi:hypothetical protein